MESWLVMLVALIIVCALCPPLLGFIMGAGAVMIATVVIGKFLGV